jgi:uncharacterized glyoxalase superfamily protein PhnB
MRDAPKGWPRISSALFYDDAAKAIDWLCTAFGFSVRIRVEDAGRIVHSELELGDGLIMVGETESPKRPEATHRKSPRALGGVNTQSLCVYIDDADAHCAHARANGAKILAEPTNQDHGADYWEDRSYEAADLEGHRWWFVQRIRG